MFLFIEDSKGRKYVIMNKFHTKIFNGEFFPNYGMQYVVMLNMHALANSYKIYS